MRSLAEIGRAQVVVERRDVHLEPETPLIRKIQPEPMGHQLSQAIPSGNSDAHRCSSSADDISCTNGDFGGKLDEA